MKFAFITDPLASIHTSKDSSYAMMREAASRGHQLYSLRQEDLAWKQGEVSAFVSTLTLKDTTDWYQLGQGADINLREFDAVLMRKDPPFDMEYIYSTYLLELAEDQGARIVNRPRAIRDFNEKLAIARFPDFAPPTLVTCQEHLIRDFLEQHGDIILKPLDGMGGRSVFRLHSDGHNVGVTIETLTHYGRRTVMAQKFLPDIASGDKRILIIGGKVVPFALARIPKQGEIRGNLAVGGIGRAQALSSRDHEIAESLAPQLRTLGLLLVGLDIIGDFLTEINVTSPTGMQEITAQTGFNVAGMMVDVLENLS
jgi:glutathione synthase